ncbi:MAG TPA: TonB-dependent receptor [Flavisolibacter sp.]|nr:TonB-dependent receptor [Flavisolibacter sp.]
MKKRLAFWRSAMLISLLLQLTIFSFAQNNFPVTGKVTDNTGKPLEGVTVQVKGTNITAVTTTDGTFSINAPSGNSVLVFSYVGFASTELPIGNKGQLNLSLTASDNTMDQVVVIGYGTVKRRDVTGAVAGIGQQEIRSRPVDNAIQAMQGKVAGVDISSNERPGTVPTVRIRGVRSLTASSDPLYVVDNIPLITGGIENINPGDIESIDVLKDASATAIYGSRGANGVVIITTKQGKAGKVTLNFNHSVTLENLVDNREMFNASEYITYKRWAYYYAGLNPVTGVSTNPRGDQPNINTDKSLFSATADPYAWANINQGWASGTWDGSKVQTTDWTGMVKEQSVTTDNTISVSAGSDKVKAYGSFGYLNNGGVIKGQSFERYTAKANVDFTATNWLSFGNNMTVSYGKQQFGQSGAGIATIGSPAGGLYESARGIYPYAVPYDSSGNRILFPGGDNSVKNIIDEDKYNIDERVTLRAFGSLYAQLNFGSIFPILKGLKYRMNFGPDFSDYRDGIYVDANSVANGGSTSYASLSNVKAASYTLDNLVYYDNTIGDHTFGLTLLQSQTKYKRDEAFVSGNGVPQSSQLWNALTTGTVTGAISTKGTLIEQQLLSYMARVNYSFKEKYLLTASARRDGSSVLAEGHKWDWFPSAALAWRISREKFMNAPWVNDLKLRIGAGVTGNSAVPAYATQGAITSLFYPFYTTSVAGAIPSLEMANLNLGWEKTTQYNVGVDFSLLRSRISGSVDVYKSKTTDLLLKRTIPSVTGYTSTFDNVGETANNGIDITVTTVNVKHNNLTWSTTLNAAWQKDHIVTLANGKQNDIANNWFIDQPNGVIYGYKALGLWQAKDAAAYGAFNANGHKFYPGNVRVADLNGDNKIDANNDREIIGWTRPRWVVGMTNAVSYKNLELSVFLYGRLNYMYDFGGEGQDARRVQRKIDYYTENNTNAEFQKPIFNAGGAPGDPYYQALGYRSASFIKVRNISLGYNFRGLGRSGLSNLRAYFQVQNPGMLYSKIKFVDMDVVGPTWNRGFTLGINASF